MMTTECKKWLRFHKITRDVGVVTLARSDKRNAFHDEMVEEFVAEMDRLSQAPPRVLLLTGAGSRCFCAGYDLACVDPDQSPTDPLPDERFEPVVQSVVQFPAPVIAVLNGSAYGGGFDLALACDFRIAPNHSQLSFAMTPCRLGLVYSAAGVKRFIDKLGSQTTRRLFLTGTPISGREALGLGVVDFLVPEEEMFDRALTLASEILKCSPVAVAGTRRTIQYVEQGVERQPRRAEELAEVRKDALKSEHLREFVSSFRSADGDASP